MRLFPLILLLFCLPLRAAEFAPKSGKLVRVWQSQDGLPSNVVRSVIQTADGYLWVATAEGVARFDGFDFDLMESEGALRGYRLAFSKLFTTGGNVVWATTYQGGLFRVDGGKIRRILDDWRVPNSPLVHQLLEYQGRAYYKLGDDYGNIDADGRVTPVEPGAGLLERFEKDLLEQQDGGRITDRLQLPHLKDRMGRIWTAGESGGLSVVDRDGGTPVRIEVPQRGLAYSVNELMEDREGNIWVASPVTGLLRIRSARVDVLDPNEGQNERAIAALTEDHTGAWWFANRRGGLIRWTDQGSEQVSLSTSRPASAIFEDRDDRLWVASRDGSVYRMDDGVFYPQFLKTQIPSKVRSITQDSKQTLWFCGSQGLASFDGENVRNFGPADGVVDNDFTVVQPYPGGRVIVGSAAGRVLLGGDRGFFTLGSPEVFRHQWISGFFSVSENETWVSTLGGGLYLWSGKHWFCFDADDGLPDARLTCVVNDGNGYLWFGSLGGIIRVERKQLLARARDPRMPVQWMRLDHTDGLPSRECIGGFQPAGWRGKDGRLWFPTGNGVARVKPDLMEQNKVPPPVYLQSVRVNGVVQPDAAKSVTTDPGRARLEFRFIGLGFSAPEKITYRARLAGLDDSWRELGTQRVAAFEAVPPGEYTFEVMAVNGDGLRSTAVARIAVKIDPHFWETPWFYLTVGGGALTIAVGSGWLAARIRLKQRIQKLKIRHAKEGERTRIARDLHDDLGASLTEISILASLAAEDAEKTPLQPALDQLSVKAKQVVGSLDEIVWAVNPREDTLRSLVEYIAAFAREFLDLARIQLRLEVARLIPEMPLPTTRRHAVFLAAREAVNNIVKHSKATEVQMRIEVTDDGVLMIRIEDNGCGFEPDYVNGGNGIGNLNQRMQDAGGSCRIETYRAQGTTVHFTLPLAVSGKSHSSNP